MARKIHRNDEVVVVCGRDKGKRGRVLQVLTKTDRVVVEGVNVITRHLKRNPRNPQAGGRVQRPASIAISNVKLWSQDDQKGVRVGFAGTGREKRRVVRPTGKPLTTSGRKREKAADKKKEK